MKNESVAQALYASVAVAVPMQTTPKRISAKMMSAAWKNRSRRTVPVSGTIDMTEERSVWNARGTGVISASCPESNQRSVALSGSTKNKEAMLA